MFRPTNKLNCKFSRNLEEFADYMPGNFYWKDITGRYLGCNDSLIKTLGMNSKEEIIGKTDYDLWPEQAEELLEHDASVVKYCKTLCYEEKVDTSIGLKQYFIAIKSPLFDEQDNVIGIIGNSYDISNIIKAQQFLKSEKELIEKKLSGTAHYLKNIIECVPGSIYWKDKQGVYLGCNHFMVNGTGLSSVNDIIGKSDYELWPEYADVLRKNDEEVIKAGKVIETEESVVLSNGGRRYFKVAKMPLKDTNGNIIGIIGNSLDITELKNTQLALKKAKEQAEIASQAKTEFMANMSHDIRTPLIGMLGMAETIVEASQEPTIKEYAYNIARASQRLLGLANNIIEATQVDMKHLPEDKQPINLKTLLKELEELFLPALLKKNLDFHLDYGIQIPKHLIGNATLIQRILLNLLGNAIKFTHAGNIKLAAEYVKKEEETLFIKFSISDTGIGIAQDKLQVIFEPFSKLSSSYKGIYQGSGLGLHIVKQAIEKLGGKIEVKSELGEGSVFAVTIPMLQGNKDQEKAATAAYAPSIQPTLITSHASLNASSTQPNSSASTLGGFRVLVVEDDDIAGKVIVMRLKQLNCTVDWVVNGKEALDKVQTSAPYDLIYMDIGLPDKSGYAVTQDLRLLEKKLNRKASPIIALTAHVDQQSKEKSTACGLNLVVNKPISQAMLQQHLNDYVMGANKPKLNENIANEPSLIIDWDLGSKIAGNRSLAEEMLSLLQQDILETLPIIQNAYQLAQWGELKKLIHKLHGGCSYCGVPRLKLAISKLEAILQVSEAPIEEINTCFNNFMIETDNLLKNFNKFL